MLPTCLIPTPCSGHRSGHISRRQWLINACALSSSSSPTQLAYYHLTSLLSHLVSCHHMHTLSSAVTTTFWGRGGESIVFSGAVAAEQTSTGRAATRSQRHPATRTDLSRNNRADEACSGRRPPPRRQIPGSSVNHWTAGRGDITRLQSSLPSSSVCCCVPGRAPAPVPYAAFSHAGGNCEGAIDFPTDQRS